MSGYNGKDADTWSWSKVSKNTHENNFYFFKSKKTYLKGQCHKIFGTFLPNPIWTGKTGSRTFCFREDIRSQSSKIACPRSQRRSGQAIFFRQGDFIFFNHCYWIAIGIPLSHSCSFKICEKPSKMSGSARVVRHVRTVNDYADTVSGWSTTTLTLCPRRQKLHGICVVGWSVEHFFWEGRIGQLTKGQIWF